MRGVILMLGAWFLLGCSLAVVQGPPRHPPSDGPIECTTSSGAPGVDIVGGLLVGTLVGSTAFLVSRCGIGEGEGACADVTSGSVILGIGLGVLAGLPWFAGGAVAESRMSACREAKAALAARLRARATEGRPCASGACAADLLCRAGICARPASSLPGEGEACLREATLPVGLCARGYVCVSGRCTSQPPRR
jgi:hypothetical protein